LSKGVLLCLSNSYGKGGVGMNGKKEFVIINRKMIEIVVHETVEGNYVATANYPGRFLSGVCSDKDPKVAFFTSIDRLIKEK
jgi:hypothetical protein